MQRLQLNKIFLVFALITTVILAYSFIFSPDVDYNTQVKPLLNKKCITCHGGVKKKAGFSLLFRSEALAATESGKPAIVPGDPEGSEMIRRLTCTDPEERMPYKAHPLSTDEIDLLKKWIRQGAKWGDHWAYTPVAQQTIPKRKGWLWGLFQKEDKWAHNDVDHFIRAALDKQDMEPSIQADKHSLLRKVSLDLTGLPAPEKTATAFLSDTSVKGYEQLVDQLLADPAYGERWTAMWMDLARYADTKGYERDDRRQIWRYRDWLINAFNNNKPYDSFLVEQIAGDLLPDATNEQYIATAFHRNTMTNDEGGTDNEEFRTAAVIDRVNTTWEVLMGTSFGCVQCHSHPYDPFRHKDYYRFLAFFNNSRDEDTYAEYPLLYEFQDDDLLKYNNLKQWLDQNCDPEQKNEITKFLRTRQPTINSLTADSFRNSELLDTKWLVMRKTSGARLRNVALQGNTRLLMRYNSMATDSRLEIRIDSPGGKLISQVLLGKNKNGWDIAELELQPIEGKHDLYLFYRSRSLVKEDDNGMMFDWFYFTNPFPGKGKPGYDTSLAHFRHLILKGKANTTPVMVENPAFMERTTRVFERGNWLLQTEAVEPGLPASLNPMPDENMKNRLGLAKWLIDKKNPLTSRTIVNRIWEQLFGQGLAETLEDMGTQGIAPTHPELLDHLAWKLMNDYQWDLKKLIKVIVMSATYRQSSSMKNETSKKDPFNKYYSRGPRNRLTAEQIRDQALAVSGVLNRKMYGPGVMPFQPAGVWSSPYNGDQWQNSQGGEQYRRAIYTYWKRTSPYPSMLNFDAVAREVCTARRINTNTPLQALTLMNDPAYLDLSRQLSFRLYKQYGQVEAQLAEAYRAATGRPATPEKIGIAKSLYDNALRVYSKDPDKTCSMTGLMDEHNFPEMAALILTVHTIMNTDEVITKY
jgi:hypothetical protein